MYAEFDADNLLTVVKRQHLELVRQADRERRCQILKPPAPRLHGRKLPTPLLSIVRGGLWLYARDRALMRMRKMPLHERLTGSSRTSKGVQACSAVK
jgi:hypothetical protein